MDWRRVCLGHLNSGAAVSLAALVSIVGLGCGKTKTVDTELDDYRRLRGELARAETSASQPRGRYLAERIRLESASGLEVTGRLVRPRAKGCFAGVLLQDGREENSGVIARLPSEFGDVVVLSLDYPSELPYTVELSDFLLRSRMLSDGARKIPAGFLLAASYLAGRTDVDTARIAIAATSFAVPFAVIAAAADERFRNVALIYGAGDLPLVFAANLPSVPGALRKPVADVAMRAFTAFAPERFVPRIAPRPLVMVNGIDDPQMPAEAVRRLYDAARAPKTMIWLRTGHLMPTDSALIRALIDTAFATLPVLRDTTSASRCARRSRE
jgi:hypothetical protein